jgi:hypothetical protein
MNSKAGCSQLLCYLLPAAVPMPLSFVHLQWLRVVLLWVVTSGMSTSQHFLNVIISEECVPRTWLEINDYSIFSD